MRTSVLSCLLLTLISPSIAAVVPDAQTDRAIKNVYKHARSHSHEARQAVDKIYWISEDTFMPTWASGKTHGAFTFNVTEGSKGWEMKSWAREHEGEKKKGKWIVLDDWFGKNSKGDLVSSLIPSYNPATEKVKGNEFRNREGSVEMDVELRKSGTKKVLIEVRQIGNPSRINY